MNAAPPPSRLSRLANEIATAVQPVLVGRDPQRLGHMAGSTCPDCDGALVEITPGTRYRCRVGHAWTAEALLDAQGDARERALWAAVRTLHEKATLSRRMAGHARDRGTPEIAQRYDLLADEELEAAPPAREPLDAACRRQPAETG